MLKPKQLKAIELFSIYDLTQKEVAEKLNISMSTINRWWHMEEFSQALHKANTKKFEKAAYRAVKKMEKLIDSKNESIAFAACREILNKSGYKEVEKVENINKEIKVTIEE